MRLLVIEDDARLADQLRRGFKAEGYAADCTATAEDARWLATENDYDAVILDIGLPDGDGFSLCSDLRSMGRWAPIVMLTARTAVPDRVRGLDVGADDYVLKPFSFAELSARIRALVRRGRLARTLNGMLDRVAESVRRERAFISAASHDLRTPIAALRTELEFAERTPDDHDGLRAAVRLAHADAVRLSNLAADLLGLAEAEATGRAIVRQPVGVNQLIEGAITRVQPLAAERSTQVRFVGSGAIVNVDRVRLEQALVNLLSNAIREGPIGSLVEVVAEVRRAEPGDVRSRAGGRTDDGSSQDPSQAVLDITVLDRGPGVAADVRPVLFVPFAARARGRSDGTGLGLATAAAAVQAHGGEIVYAGRPGGGAAFRLSVPTAVIANDPDRQTGTPPIRRSWLSPSAAKPTRRAVKPRRGRSRRATPTLH